MIHANQTELMPPTQFALWVRSLALDGFLVTHQNILNFLPLEQNYFVALPWGGLKSAILLY